MNFTVLAQQYPILENLFTHLTFGFLRYCRARIFDYSVSDLELRTIWSCVIICHISECFHGIPFDDDKSLHRNSTWQESHLFFSAFECLIWCSKIFSHWNASACVADVWRIVRFIRNISSQKSHFYCKFSDVESYALGASQQSGNAGNKKMFQTISSRAAFLHRTLTASLMTPACSWGLRAAQSCVGLKRVKTNSTNLLMTQNMKGSDRDIPTESYTCFSPLGYTKKIIFNSIPYARFNAFRRF